MEEPASRPPPAGTPVPPEKSFGNMGDHHWSRARVGSNTEALDYYRERSKAPGVAEGGGARNMYCMHCAGVIPLGTAIEACPHCGRELEGDVKRYFNWVEIDRSPKSDLRALWPVLALAVAVLAGALCWLLSSFTMIRGPGA